MNVLRVWDEARTSHFELLLRMTPGELLYRTQNYSFDQSLATSARATRTSTWGTVRAILLSDWDRLELNEPTMVGIWPRLLLYGLASRLSKILSRRRARVVLYVIDNVDLVQCVRGRLGLPRWATQLVVTLLASFFDRVAFGTRGAEQAFDSLVLRRGHRTEYKLIPQLPSPCDCPTVPKRKGSLLFLSALEDRKGIRELMAAWDGVAGNEASLTVIGKGKLATEVSHWAAQHGNVTFLEDPPRSLIHHELRQAQCVFLLSQPQECWREQVGLPVVEGLAHGCEIITSSETGLASWLSDNDHVVLSPAIDTYKLTAAIEAIIANPRAPQLVTAALPARHTRILADEWLMR
ncbi:glycosyltransferase involved in cell wall biosynthesis [Microbacterium trichothecenolyticum]|uniref:glycosyltransferase n=1 Tax=Microbacterium trichothecenolyticum TaxID=69370 RepID=UPI00285FE04A|nr:glycosyltransferase [Microbacterium trichothecenolyticum]MDR7184912.1 glycosyltransferase involved in cell wall biosynthesis [Microbacterium trichothecenolyticum]